MLRDFLALVTFLRSIVEPELVFLSADCKGEGRNSKPTTADIALKRFSMIVTITSQMWCAQALLHMFGTSRGNSERQHATGVLQWSVQQLCRAYRFTAEGTPYRRCLHSFLTESRTGDHRSASWRTSQVDCCAKSAESAAVAAGPEHKQSVSGDAT